MNSILSMQKKILESCNFINLKISFSQENFNVEDLKFVDPDEIINYNWMNSSQYLTEFQALDLDKINISEWNSIQIEDFKHFFLITLSNNLRKFNIIPHSIDFKDILMVLECYQKLFMNDDKNKGLNYLSLSKRNNDNDTNIEPADPINQPINDSYTLIETIVNRLCKKIIDFAVNDKYAFITLYENFIEKLMNYYIEFIQNVMEKIIYEIKTKKVWIMQISNMICYEALQIYMEIYKSMGLNKIYFDRVIKLGKLFEIKFLLRMLALNFHITKEDIKEEIYEKFQISILTFQINQKNKILEFMESTTLFSDDQLIDLKLIYDKNYKTYAKIFSLTWTILSNFWKITENLSNVNSFIKYQAIIEGGLYLFEELFSEKSNQYIIKEMASIKNCHLFHIFKNLINLNQPIQYYAKALKIGFKIFYISNVRLVNDEYEVLKFLWDSIQANSLIKGEYSMTYLLSLIDFLKELFQMKASFNEILQFLWPCEILIKIEKQTNMLILNDKKIILKSKLVEKFIDLIIQWPIDMFKEYEIRFNNILNALYINTKDNFYKLFVSNSEIIGRIFQDLFVSQKDAIFFGFIKHLYDKIEQDNDNECRQGMLTYIKIYFNLNNQSKNIVSYSEYYLKSIIFLLKILTSITINQNIKNFHELFKKGLDYDNLEFIDIPSLSKNIPMNTLSDFLRNKDFYISILNALDNSNLYHKNIANNLINFTFCLIHFETNWCKYFRDTSSYLRFYNLLTKMHKHIKFTQYEIYQILNWCLNITTDYEYYHIVEKKLNIKTKEYLDDISINWLKKHKEVKKSIKYIYIKKVFLIEITLNIIIYWDNITNSFQEFYMLIFKKMITKSIANAILCGKENLIYCLFDIVKINKYPHLKQITSDIIISIMKISTNPNQINALTKIMRYQKSQSVASFCQTLKYSFYILKRVFENNKTNQNFMHFSGQNSAIILPKFELSFQNIIFNISFRIESRINPDKKNIYEHVDEILYKHNIKNNSAKNDSMPNSSKILKNQGIKQYFPRIFSMVTERYILDLYFNPSSLKKQFIIEAYLNKSKTKLVEVFDIKSDQIDHIWYNIILILSPKKTFELYLDQIPLTKTYNQRFDFLLEKTPEKYLLTIGASLDDPLKYYQNGILGSSFTGFNMINNFVGQIKEFHIANASKAISNPLNDLPTDSKVAISLTHIISRLTLTRLDQANLNNSANKLLSESQDGIDKVYDIYGQEIQYMEISRFKDILFLVGNIDFIYYYIEELTNISEIDNSIIKDMLCELILTIIQAFKSQKNKDIIIFLENREGFAMLGFLLKKLIHKHGGSKNIIDKLYLLINHLNEPSLIKKGLLNLLANFDIWKICDKEIHANIYGLVYDIISSKSELLHNDTYCKELIMNLLNLYGMSTRNTKLTQNLIIKLISKIILTYKDDTILECELRCILGYLSILNPLNPNIEIYMDIILNAISINRHHNKENKNDNMVRKKSINILSNQNNMCILLGLMVEIMFAQETTQELIDHLDNIKGKLIRILTILLFDFELDKPNLNIASFDLKIHSNLMKFIHDIQTVLINLLIKNIDEIQINCYSSLMNIFEPMKRFQMDINQINKINTNNQDTNGNNNNNNNANIPNSLLNIYSLVIKLLLNKYPNHMNINVRERFLCDLNNIMQANIFNWQIFQNAKNSLTFIIYLINNNNNFDNFFLQQKETNNKDNPIEGYKLHEICTIHNYIKYLVLYSKDNQVLDYLLMYDNSNNFMKIMKLISKIISSQKTQENHHANIYHILNLFYNHIIKDNSSCSDDDNVGDDDANHSNTNKDELFIKFENDLHLLILIFYDFIKINKLFGFYGNSIKALPDKLTQNDIFNQFINGSDNIQYGGMLFIIIKIIIVYLDRSCQILLKIEILTKLQEIFEKGIWIWNYQDNKKEAKSNEFALGFAKSYDIKDMCYIYDFTFYKLLKIFSKSYKSPKLSSITSNNQNLYNKFLDNLINLLLVLVITNKEWFDKMCFNNNVVESNLNKSLKMQKTIDIQNAKSTASSYSLNPVIPIELQDEYHNIESEYNSTIIEIKSIDDKAIPKDKLPKILMIYEIIQKIINGYMILFPRNNLNELKEISSVFNGKSKNNNNMNFILIIDNQNGNFLDKDDEINYKKQLFNTIISLIEELNKELSPGLQKSSIKFSKLMQKLNKFYVFVHFKDIESKTIMLEKELAQENIEYVIHFNSKICTNMTPFLLNLLSFLDEKNKYSLYLEEKKNDCDIWIENILDYEDLIKSENIKTQQEWTRIKKNLEGERGLWRQDNIDYTSLKWKLDMTQDIYNRRLLLRVDNEAPYRNYINQYQYAKDYKKSKSIDFLGSISPGSSPILSFNSSSDLSALSAYYLGNMKSDITIGSEPTKIEIDNEYKTSGRDYLRSVEALPDCSYLPWKECERITLKGAICGKIQITSNGISFKPRKEIPKKPLLRFGALKENLILPKKFSRKVLSFNDICEIFSRNYNLVQCGFEIFTKQGKSYFFIVDSEKGLRIIFDKLKETSKYLVLIYDRAKKFQEFDYQKMWVEGQLSNFEYLMLLNKYASRSFNDINQYPVFPWILKDYTSKDLDIDTKDAEKQNEIFRDLSMPIGAMGNKIYSALEKYDADLGEKKFHHGTHYSSGAVVMNYLIRLEPFTSLNIDLQNGRFDQADRIFHSIKNSWESCLKACGDCRELIPEFFYFADFLKNINKIDFGYKQDKKKCDNVELPDWASTPEEFIYKHRQGLESEYVSKNLNNWIDLIFGYKQQGEEAAKAINLYRDITYEGHVILNNIKDKDELKVILQQICYMGQTPTQLFTQKHETRKFVDFKIPQPRRSMGSNIILNNALINNIIFNQYNNEFWKIVETKGKKLLMNHLVNLENSPVVAIHQCEKMMRIILKNKNFYTIPYRNTFPVSYFNWTKLKSKSNILNLGQLTFQEQNPQTQFCFFSPSNLPSNHVFLAAGGYTDNSFKIYKDSTLIQSIHFHKKMITTIGFFTTKSRIYGKPLDNILVVGSKDCQISLWKVKTNGTSIIIPDKEEAILYGHYNEIITLDIQQILGLIISVDKDGIILAYSIRSARLIKSYNPQLQNEEKIKMIKMNGEGLLTVITNKCRILLYSLNGEILKQLHKPLTDITCFSFIMQTNPYIILSSSNGELILLNTLTMKVINNLIKDIVYVEKYTKGNNGDNTINNVNKMLSGSYITSLIIYKETSQICCGYQNGSISIISLDDKEFLANFSEYLQQGGILPV